MQGTNKQKINIYVNIYYNGPCVLRHIDIYFLFTKIDQGFFEENCLFLGDLLEWNKDIPSSESCQQSCLGRTGCSYALYSKPLKTCYLLAVPIRRCSKTMGPRSPNIDQCKSTPTNKFFKINAVAGHIDGERSDDVESLNPYNPDSNCIKPQSYPERVENLCGDKNIFCGGYNDKNSYSMSER